MKSQFLKDCDEEGKKYLKDVIESDWEEMASHFGLLGIVCEATCVKTEESCCDAFFRILSKKSFTVEDIAVWFSKEKHINLKVEKSLERESYPSYSALMAVCDMSAYDRAQRYDEILIRYVLPEHIDAIREELCDKLGMIEDSSENRAGWCRLLLSHGHYRFEKYIEPYFKVAPEWVHKKDAPTLRQSLDDSLSKSLYERCGPTKDDVEEFFDRFTVDKIAKSSNEDFVDLGRFIEPLSIVSWCSVFHLGTKTTTKEILRVALEKDLTLAEFKRILLDMVDIRIQYEEIRDLQRNAERLLSLL